MDNSKGAEALVALGTKLGGPKSTRLTPDGRVEVSDANLTQILAYLLPQYAYLLKLSEGARDQELEHLHHQLASHDPAKNLQEFLEATHNYALALRRREKILAALELWHNGLSKCSACTYPQHHAVISKAAGNAYLLLVESSEAGKAELGKDGMPSVRECVEKGTSLHRSSLDYFTPTDDPMQYATTKLNMAILYLKQDSEREFVEAAISCVADPFVVESLKDSPYQQSLQGVAVLAKQAACKVGIL